MIHESYQALSALVTEAYRQPERCDDLLPLTLPISTQVASAKAMGQTGRFRGVVKCASCAGVVAYDYYERPWGRELRVVMTTCSCQRRAS